MWLALSVLSFTGFQCQWGMANRGQWKGQRCWLFCCDTIWRKKKFSITNSTLKKTTPQQDAALLRIALFKRFNELENVWTMKWSEVCVRISDPTTQHGYPLHECFLLIEIELNKLIELEMTDTKKLLRLSEYFEWVRRISLCRRTAALCVCTLSTVRTREGRNATLNISTSFFDQLANCPANDFTLFPWLKDNSFTCRYSLLRMLLRTNRSGGNRTPYKKIYKPLHFKTLPSTCSRVFVGAFSTQQHSRAVQCLLAAATEGSTKSMQQCFQMRRYDRANGFTAKHCNDDDDAPFFSKKNSHTHMLTNKLLFVSMCSRRINQMHY